MEASKTILALLADRAPEATICPSEVARALANAASSALGWRNTMPTVHAAVDQLVDDGLVQLSWKGRTLVTRAGPYRIGRGVRTLEMFDKIEQHRRISTQPNT